MAACVGLCIADAIFAALEGVLLYFVLLSQDV